MENVSNSKISIIAKHKIYSKSYYKTPHANLSNLSSLQVISADASGNIWGRFISTIATLALRKFDSNYSKHCHFNQKISIYNPDKLLFTGKKTENKIWFRHSTFPGGLKEEKIDFSNKKQVERLFRKTLKNMLPKNRISARIIADSLFFIYEQPNFETNFKLNKIPLLITNKPL